MEVFFRPLTSEEVASIAEGAAQRAGFILAEEEAVTIGRYAACGREAVNIVQMCAGLAQMEDRTDITPADVCWVVTSGHFAARPTQRADTASRVGFIHGLAVTGSTGALMDIESVVTHGTGQVHVTGIVDEEELGQEGHRMRRKSTARGSAENVRTLLTAMGFTLAGKDVHINFPGGAPVDGPSAGVAMTLVAISALTGQPIDGSSAVTGEITVHGAVKAVGGVPDKVAAAKAAGLTRVYIPKENDAETLHASGIEVICISTLSEAAEAMLLRAGAAEAPSAVIGLPVSAAAQGENIAPAITTAANVSHNA
jgi:Lon-like ATP-dependent protease